MMSQSGPKLRGVKTSSSRMVFGGKMLICSLLMAMSAQFSAAILSARTTVKIKASEAIPPTLSKPNIYSSFRSSLYLSQKLCLEIVSPCPSYTEEACR